jgi:hypothetical protein
LVYLLMLVLQVGLTLALLFVCTFTPGFFWVRRFRLNPMEKLCGAIGVSLILLYSVAWACACFAPQREPEVFYGASALCFIFGAVAIADIRRLFRSFRIHGVVSGFLFLLLWMLVILSMIRNYSGAGWSGDWLEHYQRTLLVLHRIPPQARTFNGYEIAARPPMMNVLAAFFMAQVTDRFEIFQVICTFLNSLVFLSCSLILPAIAGRRRWRAQPLVALFALNPVVVETATYAWTKSLTAFFVVMAISFYLAGWRKKDPVRMTWAFLSMSAGLLVHYSAGPYYLFISLHYALFVFWRRRNKWKEAAGIAVGCSLLLLTWFGWSAVRYGMPATLESNASVQAIRNDHGSGIERTAKNLYSSVVPRLLREPTAARYWYRGNIYAAIRDNAFIFYQVNVIFAIGSIGGPLVLWDLRQLIWRSAPGERAFWRVLIPFCLLAGIASIGERDSWGLAHLTLLSLQVLGITMLAGSLLSRKVIAIILVCGCAVDFFLGIFLQARLENLQNVSQKTVSPADDATFWHGWFAHNGGSISFFGDHFANHLTNPSINQGLSVLDVQSVLLLGLFFGVVIRLWKECSRLWITIPARPLTAAFTQ